MGGAVEIVSAGGVFSSQDGDLLTYTALSGNTAAASFHVIGTEILVDPGSAGSATSSAVSQVRRTYEAGTLSRCRMHAYSNLTRAT